MENAFVVINDFIIYPFIPGVMEGYQPTENFPNCCDFHKSVLKRAIDYSKEFPNCCEDHKLLAQKTHFNIKYYDNMVGRIIYRLSFTEYHIDKQIDKSDWYKDITDYIYYIISSFGTPAVGIHIYIDSLRAVIDSKRDLIEEKSQKLLDYINELNRPAEVAEEIDLNELHNVYHKWLAMFPFEVYPFGELKEQFTNQFPVINSQPVYNPYTKFSTFKITTKKELILSLIDKTKTILDTVDSTVLVENGLISDIENHTMALISKSHRLKQKTLLTEFLENENKYIVIIQKWLLNEKQYFNKIQPFAAKFQRNKVITSDIKDKKNIFNDMPLDQVEKWFMQLANNISSNKHPFLTTDQVSQFIDRAFIGNKNLPQLTINYASREKLSTWRIFFQYYQRCVSIENGVERGTQCRDKYIKLLTDNFTNFTFDEVKANFSGSNQVGRDWNLQ